MQFAALIEYLITGIISIIWLGLFAGQYIEVQAQNIKDYKEIVVICIFPIAYILGIYVDVSSSYLLRRISNAYRLVSNISKVKPVASFIKKIVTFILGTPKNAPYERSAEILSYAPSDTIRTMEAYVSRDRIARGMALNSFIGFWVARDVLTGELQRTIVYLSLAFCVISVLVWFRLRRLSKAFKTQALKQLRERSNL
jgi:ABC-type branched-subunit amino acid transport system permease subunit